MPFVTPPATDRSQKEQNQCHLTQSDINDINCTLYVMCYMSESSSFMCSALKQFFFGQATLYSQNVWYVFWPNNNLTTASCIKMRKMLCKKLRLFGLHFVDVVCCCVLWIRT